MKINMNILCVAVTLTLAGQALAATANYKNDRCAGQALSLAKTNLDQKAISESLPGARIKDHSLLLRPSRPGTSKYLVVGFVGDDTYNVVVEMDALCGANLINIQQVL